MNRVELKRLTPVLTKWYNTIEKRAIGEATKLEKQTRVNWTQLFGLSTIKSGRCLDSYISSIILSSERRDCKLPIEQTWQL